jgi:hypothetical protein
MCVQFFFVARGKILILLPLGELDRPLIGQNIGTKGVGRKILRNKELAAQIGLRLFGRIGSDPGAQFNCAPSVRSVKVVGHTGTIYFVRSCGKPTGEGYEG